MGTLKNTNLHWSDVLVVVIYFIFILVVGLWSSHKSQRTSISGYFLASRNMHWIPVGASLFASNIGSGHFIGLAGTAAASGIAVSMFELWAIFEILVLAWMFVPVYVAAGVYTMPEYLKLRFGGERIRRTISIFILLLYIFTKISADLYAGALFIRSALSWEGEAGLYLSILVLLIIAAVFTVAGGLTAVIWTDLVQTVLMVAGTLFLMVLSFVEVGGYDALIDRYFRSFPNITAKGSDNTSCASITPYAMSLFRPVTATDVPWTGIVFGHTVLGLWYWCADQVIVQRTLSSRNLHHAKAGAIFCCYLKFIPLFAMVMPGMAARVLYPDRVACADPTECKRICGNPGGCTNIAFIELVLNLLPTGLSGLMLAVMLSALMSSLTSIFNSASSIFSLDIWTQIRKKASDMELIVVGRLFVVFLLVISIIWIPIIQSASSSQLYHYMNSILSYLCPPISGIYTMGIFWSRTTEQGAFWGLVSGLVVGVTRFCIEFSYTVPACGSGEVDQRPAIIKVLVGNVHYLHFAVISIIITYIITAIISLMTPRIPDECLYRLTFWTRHSTEIRSEMPPRVTSLDTEMTTFNAERENAAGGDSISAVNDQSELPCWRKVLGVLCGLRKTGIQNGEHTIDLSPEDKAHLATGFLSETSFWKRFINVQAFIVIVVNVGLFIYYS